MYSLDSVLKLNISTLQKLGYLKSEPIESTIIWERNGNQIASIKILVNTSCEQPYVELIYFYKRQSRQYKVNLTTLDSNLGKGKIIYFLCPKTNKRCRILYCVDGYFWHREAYQKWIYDCQLLSKKDRELDKIYLATHTNLDAALDQMRKRNFKTSYAGKPTKKFMKAYKAIKNAREIPYEDVQRLGF